MNRVADGVADGLHGLGCRTQHQRLRRSVAASARIDEDGVRRKCSGAVNTIRSHRDLEAWQVAMELVDRIYDLTEPFPDKERYGLQSQLRRAGVSVPSNIAEGQMRPIRAALNQLSIALGSLAEIDTQMEIARRRRYVGDAELVGFREYLESATKLVRGLGRAKKLLLGKTVAKTAGMLAIAVYFLSRLMM